MFSTDLQVCQLVFSEDGHDNILHPTYFSSDRTLTFLPSSGGINVPSCESGKNFFTATTNNEYTSEARLCDF